MRIDVSGLKLNFPPECACCCGPAEALLSISATRTRGKRVVHTDTRVWDVPYCGQCLRHVASARSARIISLTILAAAVVVATVFGTQNQDAAAGILAVIGIGAAIVSYSKLMNRARSECIPTCASVNRAITYLGWYGTLHKFEVLSAQFAGDFMSANQKKLVNLTSEAMSLLSAKGLAVDISAPRAPRKYMT
jgi:hypothetical protein